VKRIVTVATESAMRDILQSIVDRSAKIAAIATREMVMKDFAMEPDENKMRKAAHLMVQNLASSLALVAYKDPLRTRCDDLYCGQNEVRRLTDADAVSWRTDAVPALPCVALRIICASSRHQRQRRLTLD